MTSDWEFTADEIRALLEELGRRLDAQSLSATIYVIGGAAIALTLDRRRVTKDIDAIFVPDEAVRDAAAQMAEERSLPADWLNAAAGAYVPGGDEAVTTFEVPGLAVSMASPKHLLAMKMAAFRAQDQGDLALLFRTLGVVDSHEAVEMVFAVYGDYAEMFGPRADYLMRAEAVLARLAAG